jgi:serine/threonine-protein kinase
MTLSPGARVGSYEISDLIGVGGMGEVYRATDGALGRVVAIKVLPEAVAHDPERLARFDREARTLAGLNHPNIAVVHGLEKAHGATALVMEFVDGPTLAERMARKPLPVAEALRIAKQIAAALEAAHARGVVHRDLKPANVKLRSDGTVKVLDFGLAKSYASAGAGDHLQSATVTSPAQTMAGVILGTAAYMSPEQAAGSDIDQRSDIWSFGVVVYEMLTGQRLFDGPSVPQVIARVLERDIDLSNLPAATPPSIRNMLRRCLERDPNRRLHHIADARLEIEDALTARPHESPAAPARVKPRWVAAAGVLVIALGALIWTLPRFVADSPRTVFRSSVDLPTALPSITSSQRDLAISRDGTLIAFSGASGKLYLKRGDQIDFDELAGVAGTDPTFSPDGSSVAFFDFTKTVVRRATIGSGTAADVSPIDGSETRGIAWGPDDILYFATNTSRGLFKVSARGGTPQRVTTVDEAQGELSHLWPTVLPNGKGVLFSACGISRQTCRLAALSLASGEVTRFVSGSDPHFIPGFMVYAADNGLRAVAFDQDRLVLSADEPVTVVDGVLIKATGAADFDVAANGALIWAPGGAARLQRTLVWADRTGKEEATGHEPRGYGFVRISPDGQRVAASADGGVWVSDLDRPAFTLLTGDVKADAVNFPFWTPDNRRIVFSANALSELFWTAADGAEAAERLFAIKGNVFISPEGWVDDGRALVFTYNTVAEPRIGILKLDDKSWRPLVARAYDASMLSVHPDGKWLVYQSDSSGKYEIYMERFPELGDRRKLSTIDGGWAPVWAQNGREVYYRRVSDGAMMAVRIETTPTLRIEPAVKLFDSRDYEPLVPPVPGRPAGRTFDVAPDGRFLMLKEMSANASSKIVSVQNFDEELRQSARK